MQTIKHIRGRSSIGARPRPTGRRRSRCRSWAFYADCRHHVRPVTSGFRVVLTYNLLLEGDTVTAAAGRADPGLTADLASCLNEHFGDSDEPTRLVYLLDHEYTQRALSWAGPRGTRLHLDRLRSRAASSWRRRLATSLFGSMAITSLNLFLASSVAPMAA